VKERDRSCVDCGRHDLGEYDHVPEYETTAHHRRRTPTPLRPLPPPTPPPTDAFGPYDMEVVIELPEPGRITYA
jgi:hypothetical protein